MSATGSVNLIVCFSSSRPFAPRSAENLRRLVYLNTLLKFAGCARECLLVLTEQLPGRLRNAWNLALQRQTAETQAAQTELAQIGARPPANLAAVVLARRKFRLLASLGLSAPSYTSFRSVVVNLTPFCCQLATFRLLVNFQSQNCNSSPHARNGMPRCFSNDRAWSSDRAVVTMVTFMPFNLSTFE